ncbi:MAG: hypothetical protein OXC31_10765 [Spirochaetaceae bacterium]|nr:hypothetical protein [Spirochaetaceae bacterium]
MALSEERQQVLRMVEQGTISADEGSKLIMALGGDEQAEQQEPEPPEEHAEAPAEAAATNDEVQVRIALASGDGHVVTLVLPLQLARFALPLLDLPHAAVLGEHGVDINRIREALRSGEPCDILDYQDEESGHRIQIVIA